ncbi:MAG: hypothetical protein HDS92_03030 [Bacteroidales bacterium]|nr:hypothetical protein [Bacteroidales bacterium]
MAKEPLNIVTLRRVSYNDRHSIITAWSRERGRVSLLVPDNAGRSGARARALMAPPSLAGCLADIRPGRDIFTVSDIRPLHPLADLRANPLKSMVAMFLAEVMAAILRESQPDAPLFDFVKLALEHLDALTEPRAVANFHLCFLYQLGRFLGVEPDASTWRPGRLLDMHDGLFRATPPPHADFLDAAESEAAALMSRMTFDNIKKWRLTRHQRNRSLDVILRYFAIHLAPGLAQMQSLEVFRALS